MSLKPLEEKLIFLATQPTDKQDEIEKILDKELDWNFIVNTASSLELIPLLNHGLYPFYKTKIPPKVISFIKDKVRFVTGLNLGYFKELKRFVGKLDKANIPVCLLKGASVAIPVYGSISLRSFGDIDLLIGKDDLEKAIELFREDYTINFFLPNLDMCKKYHFHISLSRKKPPSYCFEIHWALFTPDSYLNLPPTVLWENIEVFLFEDSLFKTLSPENSFIHLIIHFTRNAFSSPRDLWDIYWLINRKDVNFGLLVERVRKFGMERRLAASMLFIDSFFGTSYIKEMGLKVQGLGFILNKTSISFLVERREKPEENIRAVIAFLLQENFLNKFSFLRRIIYPGVYWLSIYPPDLEEINLKTRLKIALRGIRLFAYILIRFYTLTTMAELVRILRLLYGRLRLK